MNPSKPKVRTDYHELFSSSDSQTEESAHHWVKTALLIGFGFILGVIYCKTFVKTPCEMLALSSVEDASVSAEVAMKPNPKHLGPHSKV